MGLKSKLEYFSSRLLLRIEGLGEFQRKESFSYEDINEDVYWFSDKAGDSFLGKKLLNNSIAMNQTKLETCSDKAYSYVFLHEYGHKTVNPVWRYSFYPLIIIAFLGSLGASISLLLAPLLFFLHHQSLNLALSSIFAIFPLTMIYLLSSIAISWLDEGYAELFAIKKMGVEEARQAIKDLEEDKDEGTLSRIWHRFRYPPRSLILSYVESIE